MQARLRAQLGDRYKYSGERRRRSVVVASIVLTITDPLRGSHPFWYYLQAALIRSCGASFACMELTIISRFQRPQASTKPLLHSLFYSFSELSPLACFKCADTLYVCIETHAFGESTEKVEKRDFRAVGNGKLWLTPCKLACERCLETGPNIVASVGDGRSW